MNNKNTGSRLKETIYKLVTWICDAFWVIFHPSYWIMNYGYSKEWDSKLNQLLDLHQFELVDAFSARIGGVPVWTENHPYASFTLLPKAVGRPSRRTIRRANEKYLKDIFAQLDAKPNHIADL